MAFFNHKQYNNPGSATGYKPITDTMANLGMTIGFQHVLSGEELYFKAFILSFNETFSSDWSSEPVFGRADPIYTFKQTTRKISLNFKAIAESEGDAYENLAKAQKLIQFLYPAYTELEDVSGNMEKTSANTLAQSPLVRLKFLNFLKRDTEGVLPSEQEATDLYTDYVASSGVSNGLLGFIDSLTVNHNLENSDNGTIEKSFESGDSQGSGATILPKFIEFSMGFTPIHEAPLGWKFDSEDNNSVKFMSKTFPYDANLSSGATSESEDAASTTANSTDSDPSEDNPDSTVGADPDSETQENGIFTDEFIDNVETTYGVDLGEYGK